MSIAFCALMGFALGHRLHLFGFIVATTIVAGGAFAVEFSLLATAFCAGAFQIAAFASMMVVRLAGDSEEDRQAAVSGKRFARPLRGVNALFPR